MRKKLEENESQKEKNKLFENDNLKKKIRIILCKIMI